MAWPNRLGWLPKRDPPSSVTDRLKESAGCRAIEHVVIIVENCTFDNYLVPRSIRPRTRSRKTPITSTGLDASRH